MNKTKAIIVAGCGPGHPDYVCPVVKKAVEGAQVLVGAPHLLDLFAHVACERIVVQGSMSASLDQVALLHGKKIVFLVSGDTGIYSLAQLVVRRFGRDNCQVLPGISSVQVAFARLALDWSDALLVSAHGRLPLISSDELQKHPKIAILAGTADAVNWCAEQLESLAESYQVISCEDLTLATEQIRTFFCGAELTGQAFASRTIFIFLRKELLA